MARLNITVPDMLYARLEQLRDRINLSKVCAIALEKEVIMLEGQPPITDPRIARLLQRLQSTRERWHQRGYGDGIGWAVDLATRDELQSVAIHLAELDGGQLAEFFQMRSEFDVSMQFAPPPEPPHAFYMQPPMEAGQVTSEVVRRPPIPKVPGMAVTRPAWKGVVSHHHRAGIPFPGFPNSFHPAERLQYWQEQDRKGSAEAPQGEAARVEIDEGAYLEGWRDAVKGIWQTISPALS